MISPCARYVSRRSSTIARVRSFAFASASRAVAALAVFSAVQCAPGARVPEPAMTPAPPAAPAPSAPSGPASRATAPARADGPFDPNVEARVDAVLARMTLPEKVGQLVQRAAEGEDPFASGTLLSAIESGAIGSVLNVTGAARARQVMEAARKSRLGIPVITGFDVIHGYRTIVPIPLAEACSWDPPLAERDAAMAAREAQAAGINWTFAPMMDVARDARWGRVAEGAGEDPYLGAAFAAARVRGFQSVKGFAACAKHYVGYGAAEAGREYNSTEISERTLRDVYLPPFHAAVDAGVLTVMSAFNDLSGIPASGNHHTLTDILRGEWGFRGFVVSDWASIAELVTHGYAADLSDAARKGLGAGVDMEMQGGSYRDNLARLVSEGRVDPALVDQAVRRVLRVKAALGLFDAPLPDPSREEAAMLTPENRALAREAAERSIVLLRNDRRTLPLSKHLKNVAVIGPLADDADDVLGTWSGKGIGGDAVPLLAGLRAALPGVAIASAKGCTIDGSADDARADDASIADAVTLARGKADAIIVAVGESRRMSGEAASRSDIGLPGRQEELVEKLVATGKPVVVVLMNGRPLAIPWIATHAPAVVEAWHLGVEAGPAIAAVLTGDASPSGRLVMSFPRAVGQEPLYYDHRHTGRPADLGSPKDRFRSKYIDVDWTPQFPFGWGLTYTTFHYDHLAVSPASMPANGALHVSAEITNTGDREGTEVVQLYVRNVAASVTRPVRELKGFQRVTLKAGEHQTVTFTLDPSALAFVGEDMGLRAEAGQYDVWIAPNALEGLEGSFELTGAAR